MEQINQNTEKNSFWKKHPFLIIYTILIILLLSENWIIEFFDIAFKIALLVLVWIQIIISIRNVQKLQIPVFVGSSILKQLAIIVSIISMILFLIVFSLLILLFIFGKGDNAVEEFEFIFEVFSLSMIWAVFFAYLLFKWKLWLMLLKGSFMVKLVALAITGIILFTPILITNIAVVVFVNDGKSSSGSSWDWDDD